MSSIQTLDQSSGIVHVRSSELESSLDEVEQLVKDGKTVVITAGCILVQVIFPSPVEDASQPTSE